MNPLKEVPWLNNRWVGAKRRVKRWRRRRQASLVRDVTVDRPRNVLMVVIDCLRADHVSGFGYDRPTTPTLDAFEAASFPQSTAASPWTFPSVPSLLSGRYPRNHGARFDDDPRDFSSRQFPRLPSDDVPMLPDLLSSDGYETGMFTAIPMAEKAVGHRFDHATVGYWPADRLVEKTLSWLDGREQWFAYVQLGDPHTPLDIPERYRETFDVPDRDDLESWQFRSSTDDPDFEAYRDGRIRAYDAAIRAADDAVDTLLEMVDDETAVVVCGDHGEAFWEHTDLERSINDDPRGFYGTDHGHSLFEETTQVPLWLHLPEFGNDTNDSRVSLVDVAPTILDSLEVHPRPEMDGVQLPRPDESSPIFSEETAYGYNQVGVWLDGKKAIQVPATDTTIAFDLTSDPSEQDPLDGVPAELRVALSDFQGEVVGGKQLEVDDDTANRLRELGYLEE